MSGGGGLYLDLIPMVNTKALTGAFSQMKALTERMGADMERIMSTAAKATSAQATKASESAVQSMATTAKAAAEIAQKNAIAAEKSMVSMGAAAKEAGRLQIQAAQATEAAMAKSRKAIELEEIQLRNVLRLKGQNVVSTGELSVAEGRLAVASGEVAAAQKAQAAQMALANRATAVAVGAKNDLAIAENRYAAAAERSAVATGKANTAAATAAGTAKLATAAKYGMVGYAIAVGVSVKKAADFQRSQELLVASAGESASNLKTVSDGLLKMAGDVGYSAQALSKGMYTVESAGYRGADGLKVMKAAAQGAKAENADLTEVSQGLTTSLHDFHIPAEKANDVMSKMVVAVGHSKANFQQFSSSLSSVEPAAAGAKIKLEDVYGTLAMMTQSGMSAKQATENMRNAINSLQAPTQTMRDEMAQFGLSADEVKQHLGQKGLSGTMQEISDAIRSHLNPQQQLVIDTMYKSKTAAADLDKMYAAMPSGVRKLADAMKAGTIDYTGFRKAAGTLSVDQRAQAMQYATLSQKAHGYNTIVKNGQGTIQLYGEALKRATGTVAAQSVALQVTGNNAGATNELIKKLGKTTSDANGDVKGFHEMTGTMNVQLDKAKAAVGAVAIQIGTVFLPVVTRIIKAIADFATGLSHHSGIVKGVTVAIGLLTAGFVIYKTATVAAGVATTVYTGIMRVARTAQAVFNGELALTAVLSKANPVGLIVVAIAALVAGVIYAYKHWSGFREVVQKIWEILKKVGSFLATVFKAVWNGIVAAVQKVVEVFKKTHGAIALVLGPVGLVIIAIKKMAEHWDTIKTVLASVWKVIKIVGAVIATVIGVVIVVAFKAFIYWVKFLWNNVIQPIFKLIGTIFHWLWENIIKPIIGFIVIEIKGWAAIMSWLWDVIVSPIFKLIGAIWHWLWDNVIKPVIGFIVDQIKLFGATMSWLYDKAIKPIMDGIKTVFKNTAEWIRDQWDKIKGYVKTPIKFIVETVYNGAIVPVWNGIAGVFGLGKLNKVDAAATAGFAGGGVMGYAGGGTHNGYGIVPGYAPGVDSVPANLAPGTGVLVPEAVRGMRGMVNRLLGYAGGGYNSVVSPGEATIPPAAVAALGGPQGLWAINHHYSGGRPNANGTKAGTHFDGGGIKGFFGKVKDFAFDSAKFAAKVVTDPVGAVREAFQKVTEKTQSTPDGGKRGEYYKAIVGMPAKVIDGAIEKAKQLGKSLLGMTTGPGGLANAGQITGYIVAALRACGLPVTPAWIAGYQTLIKRESNGVTNAVNNSDSNAAAGHPSRGLTQTIPSTFMSNHQPGTSMDINDPVANIAASINYVRRRYGVADDGSNLSAAVQQADPTRPPKGYAGGGIAAMLRAYANGGVHPAAYIMPDDRGPHRGKNGPRDKNWRPRRSSPYFDLDLDGVGDGYAGGGIAALIKRFADGGVYQPTDHEKQQLGGAEVATSMWQAIKTAIPGATLNSAKTDHGVDRGYHPEGKAIDIGGPLGQIDDYIFKNLHDQTAQLIYNGSPRELIYNVTEQGHGGVANITDQNQLANQVYAADLPGHSDHVHWAAEKIISLTPGASTTATPGADGTTTTPGADGTTTTTSTADAAQAKVYTDQADGYDLKAQEKLKKAKEYDDKAAQYEAEAASAKTEKQKQAKLKTAQNYRDSAQRARDDAQGYTDKAGVARDKATTAMGGSSDTSGTSTASKWTAKAKDKLAEAKRSDDLAKKYQGQADAARKSGDATRANKFQTLADKERLKAANARRIANSYTLKAQKAAQNGSGSGSSSDSSSGGLLTVQQFGERMGGLAASGVTETFGLSAFDDPNSFPLIRIPYTIGNSIWQGSQGKQQQLQVPDGTIGSPNWYKKSPGADGSQTQSPGVKQENRDLTGQYPNGKPGGSAKAHEQGEKTKKNGPDDDVKNKKLKKVLYDDGGWLEPGLTLVDNKSRRPEPILNFEDKRKLDGIGDGGGARATVLIEQMHNHGADGKGVARDIYREMAGRNKGGRR